MDVPVADWYRPKRSAVRTLTPGATTSGYVVEASPQADGPRLEPASTTSLPLVAPTASASG